MTKKLLIRNARVFDGFAMSQASTIAAQNGRILGLGEDHEFDGFVDVETETVDANQQLVCPGFIDTHRHPTWIEEDEEHVDLSHARSIKEILKLLRDGRSKSQRDWIVARGYDQAELIEGRHITALDLVELGFESPVLIVRKCQHTGVLNSAALELAGLTNRPELVDSGAIEQDLNGSLSGIVHEAALDAAKGALPEPTLQELQSFVESATARSDRLGITTMSDSAVGYRHGARELEAYIRSQASGFLGTRTELSLYENPMQHVDWGELEVALINSECLWVGFRKVFIDGAAGSGTARMSQPYFKQGAGFDARGLVVAPSTFLSDRIHPLLCKGMSFMVHAIGDEAIDIALLMLVRARREHEHAQLRIEHATFVRSDQIELIEELGVHLSVQPSMLYQSGHLYEDLLGPERSESAIPLQKILKRSLEVAISSDAPVLSGNPFVTIRDAVNRRTIAGKTLGENERISVHTALSLMTGRAGKLLKSNQNLGVLKAGSPADLVLLSENFLDSPDALSEACPTHTIRSGAVVYRA